MPAFRIRGQQLNLFHPAPMRPQWGKLPPEVRSRVVELLVQLMQAPSPAGRRGNSRVAADRRTEVGDE